MIFSDRFQPIGGVDVDTVGVVGEREDPAADPAAVEVDTHTRADLDHRFEIDSGTR